MFLEPRVSYLFGLLWLVSIYLTDELMNTNDTEKLVAAKAVLKKLFDIWYLFLHAASLSRYCNFLKKQFGNVFCLFTKVNFSSSETSAKGQIWV